MTQHSVESGRVEHATPRLVLINTPRGLDAEANLLVVYEQVPQNGTVQHTEYLDE